MKGHRSNVNFLSRCSGAWLVAKSISRCGVYNSEQHQLQEPRPLGVHVLVGADMCIHTRQSCCEEKGTVKMDRQWWGVEHTILCKLTTEGLADKVTFEQRPKSQKGSAGVSPRDWFQMVGIANARIVVDLAHSRISRAQCSWRGMRNEDCEAARSQIS